MVSSYISHNPFDRMRVGVHGREMTPDNAPLVGEIIGRLHTHGMDPMLTPGMAEWLVGSGHPIAPHRPQSTSRNTVIRTLTASPLTGPENSSPTRSLNAEPGSRVTVPRFPAHLAPGGNRWVNSPK